MPGQSPLRRKQSLCRKYLRDSAKVAIYLELFIKILTHSSQAACGFAFFPDFLRYFASFGGGQGRFRGVAAVFLLFSRAPARAWRPVHPLFARIAGGAPAWGRHRVRCESRIWPLALCIAQGRSESWARGAPSAGLAAPGYRAARGGPVGASGESWPSGSAASLTVRPRAPRVRGRGNPGVAPGGREGHGPAAGRHPAGGGPGRGMGGAGKEARIAHGGGFAHGGAASGRRGVLPGTAAPSVPVRPRADIFGDNRVLRGKCSLRAPAAVG